jgi:hypothetical protein
MAISPDGEFAAIGGTQSILPAGARDPNQSLDLIKHQPQIYMVSLRQRKVVKIIPCEVVGPIAWSPHGDRLALVGGPDVEIVDSRADTTFRDLATQ